MPKKGSTPSKRRAAGARLPTMGAEASLGRATRTYKSPMAPPVTGHSGPVVPNLWEDAADLDDAEAAADITADGADDAGGDGEDAENGSGFDDATDDEDESRM